MPRTTFYQRKNVRVTIQPNIGLDANARQSVVDMLNLLLADEAVLSMKIRRADGKAGGLDIPDLQSLYDSQYKQINAISNEITERVQILGGAHLNESEKLFISTRLGGEIKTVPGTVSILADQEALIRFLREDAQKCSEMFEDQGTYVLLVNIMRIHEKMAWILRSNIATEQIDNQKVDE